MAEKKSPRKKEAKAAPAEAPAPVAQAPAAPAASAAPEAPKVIGPGVMKRPKRDPNAPPPPGEVPDYRPSDQVFRRRG